MKETRKTALTIIPPDSYIQSDKRNRTYLKEKPINTFLISAICISVSALAGGISGYLLTSMSMITSDSGDETKKAGATVLGAGFGGLFGVGIAVGIKRYLANRPSPALQTSSDYQEMAQPL